MLVGISNPELISAPEIVKDATRAEEMMDGRGHVFTDRSSGIFGIDEGLRIVEVLVKRKEKSGFLVPTEGTGQRTFVKLALLRGFLIGEGVSSIENRIANQKINVAMKVRSPALRDNFEPCPPWP